MLDRGALSEGGNTVNANWMTEGKQYLGFVVCWHIPSRLQCLQKCLQELKGKCMDSMTRNKCMTWW